ncbi:hypothetical protein EDD11_006773 [Mortierella claussenii]|nr:hypothetical protein EDD11_006773 [Mortierella claussenii]
MAAFTRNSESQSKTGGATSTKRRASSSTKPVDQETREMMRKVSHSAIERRRRERINDKILQLKHLVPACIDEDHLHKLSILQSTIEYIQYLKSVIPESVANAKFQKATNSNPNNKTTDMLEALSSTNTATSFVPVMTTGLGYPYSKRVKTSHTDVSRQGSSPHLSPLSIPPDSQQASTTHSPLDEDAKDGLLLLSQITGALSTNASPSLTSQAQMSRGNNVDTSRSQLALRRTTKDRSVKEDQEDEKEDEDQQYESEMTDDQEDDDYQYEDKMMDEEEEEEKEEGEEGEEGEEQGDMEIGKERKQAMKRTSSKMSVEQMLC